MYVPNRHIIWDLHPRNRFRLSGIFSPNIWELLTDFIGLPVKSMGLVCGTVNARSATSG